MLPRTTRLELYKSMLIEGHIHNEITRFMFQCAHVVYVAGSPKALQHFTHITDEDSRRPVPGDELNRTRHWVFREMEKGLEAATMGSEEVVDYLKYLEERNRECN